MKNRPIIFLGLALTVGVLLSSCSKMDVPAVEDGVLSPELTCEEESHTGAPMTIGAVLDEEDTKTVASYEGGRIKMTWAEGDGFVIKPFDKQNDASYASVFTLTSGTGSNVAYFSGNAPATSSNGYYMFFYPASLKTYSSFAYFDYRGQVQSGNGRPDHLAKYFSSYQYSSKYDRVNFSLGVSNTYKQSSAFHFLLNDLPEAFVPTGIVLEIAGNSGTSFSIYNRKDLDRAQTKVLTMKLADFESTSSLDLFMARDMNQMVIPAGDTLKMAVAGTRSDGTKVEYMMDRVINSSMTLSAGKMFRMRFDNSVGKWVATASSVNYVSSDYSKDGELCFAQRASAATDRPLDIIFLGDGYADKDLALYKSDMEWTREQLFSIEPFKSYRQYFNLYSAYAVSRERLKYTSYANGAQMGDCTTALSAKLTPSSTVISGNNTVVYEYAYKAIMAAEGITSLDNLRKRNVLVIVCVNADAHAGTAHQSYSSSYGTDFGEGATVAYYSRNGNESKRRGTMLHEAGGHGFAKLGDEYTGKTTIGGVAISNDDRYKVENVFHRLGWRMNISAIQTFYSTSDPTLYDVNTVAWQDFMGDTNYPEIGKYVGAFGYNSWFWRPTNTSIMKQSTECPYFNAPSRRAIWYRINKMANSSFANDYAAFRIWDAAHGDKIPASVSSMAFDPEGYLQEDPGLNPYEGHTPPIVTEE